MLQKFKTFFVGFILVAVGIVASFVFYQDKAKSDRCTATVQGKLDDSYTIRVSKRYGFETGRSYEVKYAFQVNGKTYRGQDKMDEEPKVADTTVQYDPNDPSNNQLNPKGQWYLFLIAGGLFVGGLLTWAFGLRR